MKAIESHLSTTRHYHARNRASNRAAALERIDSDFNTLPHVLLILGNEHRSRKYRVFDLALLTFPTAKRKKQSEKGREAGEKERETRDSKNLRGNFEDWLLHSRRSESVSLYSFLSRFVRVHLFITES